MSDLVSSFLKTSFLILDCQNWHIVTIYKLDNNLCCERKLKYRAAHEWCHGGNLRNKCRQKENNIFKFLNFFLYPGLDIPDNLETISAVTSLMGHTVGKFIYSEKPTKIRRNFHADLLFSKKLIKWEISSNLCGLLRIYELYLLLSKCYGIAITVRFIQFSNAFISLSICHPLPIQKRYISLEIDKVLVVN